MTGRFDNHDRDFAALNAYAMEGMTVMQAYRAFGGQRSENWCRKFWKLVSKPEPKAPLGMIYASMNVKPRVSLRRM